jgi:hypothetical protein
MSNTPCVHTHPCALRRIVIELNADRDENREQQNDRQWRHIIADASVNGDSLDYDGPLTFA